MAVIKSPSTSSQPSPMPIATSRIRRTAAPAVVGTWLVALLVCAPSAAAADERRATAEPTFSITPMLGRRTGGRFDSPDGDDRRNVDDDTSVALALNLMQAPGRFYEGLYSRQSTSFERDDGLPLALDIEYLHIGGMLMWPQRGFQSFVTGTLGATRLDPEGPAGSRTRPSISLGVGAHVPFNRHVGLRLEARGYLTLTEGDEEIFCVSAPPQQAGCAARYSGNTLVQVEALAGISIAF